MEQRPGAGASGSGAPPAPQTQHQQQLQQQHQQQQQALLMNALMMQHLQQAGLANTQAPMASFPADAGLQAALSALLVGARPPITFPPAPQFGGAGAAALHPSTLLSAGSLLATTTSEGSAGNPLPPMPAPAGAPAPAAAAAPQAAAKPSLKRPPSPSKIERPKPFGPETQVLFARFLALVAGGGTADPDSAAGDADGGGAQLK